MTTTSKFFAGRLEFFDTVTFEDVLPVAPIVYYQDFLGEGYATIPAAGSAWRTVDFVTKIVLTAGTPTVAGVAKAIGGQVACALAATSEKEDAVLYLGRQPRPGLHQGPESSRCRALLSVVPSAAGVQAVWGCRSASGSTGRTTTPATCGSAPPRRRGPDEAFDGVTTTSIADRCHGWHDRLAYLPDRRERTLPTWRSSSTASGQRDSMVNFAATGTLAVLQPYLACYKPCGTGVATLTIDFVRAWMNRQ